jgi:hypothetical protein
VDLLCLLARPESGDPAGRRVLFASDAHCFTNASCEKLLQSNWAWKWPRASWTGRPPTASADLLVRRFFSASGARR